MKKIFTLLTMALLAIGANAQTAKDAYLDITQYATLTDESINILSNNEGVVKHLSAIDIVACSNVINNSNDYLKQKFPKLEVFQVFF